MCDCHSKIDKKQIMRFETDRNNMVSLVMETCGERVQDIELGVLHAGDWVQIRRFDPSDTGQILTAFADAVELVTA